MGKRRNYPQKIDIDICSCGSTDITCADSRNDEGIRFRRKKCNECGRTYFTREIAEEEWQELVDFRNQVNNLVKEIKI